MINRADWTRATSTTAIGTTATAVTGLARDVISGGVYHVKAWVPLVNVGSPTNVDFSLTGPATSACQFTVKRYTAIAPAVAIKTAFAAATAGTAVVTILVEIEGTFVASANGTVAVSGIRVAGTSSTTQIGAFMECERIG